MTVTLPPLSPPRARLAEAVASFGSAAYRDRGARFLARVEGNGRPIGFNNLSRMPRWWSAPEADREPIAAIAALLNFRAQIDQELDGNRLRALVSTTGETLFDIACDSEVRCTPLAGSVGENFPIGDEVRRAGWTILYRALPSAFASTIADACGDRDALEIADQASQLWGRHQRLNANDKAADNDAAGGEAEA